MDPNWRLNNNEVGTKKLRNAFYVTGKINCFEIVAMTRTKKKTAEQQSFVVFDFDCKGLSGDEDRMKEVSCTDQCLKVLRGSISSVDLLFSCKRERSKKEAMATKVRFFNSEDPAEIFL